MKIMFFAEKDIFFQAIMLELLFTGHDFYISRFRVIADVIVYVASMPSFYSCLVEHILMILLRKFIKYGNHYRGSFLHGFVKLKAK